VIIVLSKKKYYVVLQPPFSCRDFSTASSSCSPPKRESVVFVYRFGFSCNVNEVLEICRPRFGGLVVND